MPASIYKFSAPKSYDHDFVDAETGEKIGELRLKPSSILWKPKSAHEYYSATLDEFTAWIKVKNHKVAK